MNQINQKQSDFEALEKLEDIIEQAKLELQKAISLLTLDVNAREAFSGVISAMDEMEKIALQIEHDEVVSLASEKIIMYSKHFDETIKQVPSNLLN